MSQPSSPAPPKSARNAPPTTLSKVCSKVCAETNSVLIYYITLNISGLETISEENECEMEETVQCQIFKVNLKSTLK